MKETTAARQTAGHCARLLSTSVNNKAAIEERIPLVIDATPVNLLKAGS